MAFINVLSEVLLSIVVSLVYDLPVRLKPARLRGSFVVYSCSPKLKLMRNFLTVKRASLSCNFVYNWTENKICLPVNVPLHFAQILSQIF